MERWWCGHTHAFVTHTRMSALALGKGIGMRYGITNRLASRRSSAQRFVICVFALLALTVALIPRLSHAAVIDWSSTATTNVWALGLNWVGNTAPANSLNTDIARFDQTSYLTQPNSGTTSINGIGIGDGTTATATLTLTNTALSIGSSGITMFANAGAATLTGGSVKIGANENWANNSSSLLTISSAVTNTGNITPFALTVNGSGSGGTTIGGIISNGGTTGTTALTINTTGGVTTLSGINTFTGGTTLTLGTLKLSGSGTLGGTSSTLTVNGGTLDFNGTSQGVGNFAGSGGTILNNSTGTNVTLTIGNGNGTGGNYSGVIADHTSGTGTVALTKTGTGTITLSGANTYTGTTTVNAGSLFANNTSGSGTGTGTVTVNNTGTFGGGNSTAVGGISGAVTVASGGNLSPGQTGVGSTAILKTGALTLNSGSNFNVDLNDTTAGTGYDQASVAGTLSITGSNLVVTAGSGLSIGNKFFIALNDGTDLVTGTFSGLANGATVTASNNADTFLINYLDNGDSGTLGNDISLTCTGVVPEPATYLAGILALGAVGYHQRRRFAGPRSEVSLPARRSLTARREDRGQTSEADCERVSEL